MTCRRVAVFLTLALAASVARAQAPVAKPARPAPAVREKARE